jgi:hypothetical protein
LDVFYNFDIHRIQHGEKFIQLNLLLGCKQLLNVLIWQRFVRSDRRQLAFIFREEFTV